jgi:hypothetical protein
MTVTDAFLLARYAASSDAGFKRMGVKDFALRVAYDFFERKTSSEPFSEIILHPTSSQQQQPETSNVTLTWEQAMEFHKFGKTNQRDGNGALVRRSCTMKEEGCKGGTGTSECQHPACLATKKAKTNRFGDTFGVFVCSNIICQKKHWVNVANQSNMEA